MFQAKLCQSILCHVRVRCQERRAPVNPYPASATRAAPAASARVWLMIAFMTTLAASGLAAAPGQAADAYLGQVRGDRVRVRTGGSNKHYPFSVVIRGEPVVVADERAGWCRILIPRAIPVYVHGGYVEMDRPDRGTVVATKLVVRVVPEQQHEAVGLLDRGETVDVLGRVGDWLRIVPPANTFAWVHGDYIEKVRSLTPDELVGVWAQARSPAGVNREVVPHRASWHGGDEAAGGALAPEGATAGPDRGAVDVAATAEGAVAREGPVAREAPVAAGESGPARPWPRAVAAAGAPAVADAMRDLRVVLDSQPPGYRDFGPIVAGLRRVVARSEDLGEVERARTGLEIVERLEERGKRIRGLEMLLARADGEDERLQNELKDLKRSRLGLEGVHDDRAELDLARGWVRGNGRFIGRQGTHRLMKGNRVLYYLEADKDSGVDLDGCLGKRVSVRGVIKELDPKYGADLVMVSDVRVLATR